MDDGFDLERFVLAQDADNTYDHAIAELRAARKTTHWMWFVFPQIAGLGHSEMARRYALSSLEEARSYLRHPVLGPRLLESANIVADTEGTTAVEILGSIDARKLQSSVTLFLRAAPAEPVFSKVLGLFYDGLPDRDTDHIIDYT